MWGCGEIFVPFACPTPSRETLNLEVARRCWTQIEANESFVDAGVADFRFRYSQCSFRGSSRGPGGDAPSTFHSHICTPAMKYATLE